jgi:CheY-like chemotaxis protein
VKEKKAILLVMDDEEQVILAMRALREHGIVHEVEEVVIAGDGCEALAYLFSEAERALRDEKANTDRNSRQPLNPQ